MPAELAKTVARVRLPLEVSMKSRVLLALAASALLAFAGSAAGAAADRHQVQPRRRRRHAQGQGRRILQEARRGAHQGHGQGRGLSEQPAVQGRRGDGSAAARVGADARTLGGEVRAARRARVRGLRPAVHLRQLRRPAQGHRRPGRQDAVQEARDQGHHRTRLLGQRLQGHERQQGAADCPATSRA